MHRLSDKTIAQFQQRLNELRFELDAVLRAKEAADANDAVAERRVSSFTRAHLAAELRRVELALRRSVQSRFGECHRCASPLAKNLLLADPTVRFCAVCVEAGAAEPLLARRAAR